MKKCPQCLKELPDEQYACEVGAVNCPIEIASVKAVLTPALVAKIAKNEMPECFEVSRSAFVAMGMLLQEAMTLVENCVTLPCDQCGHVRDATPSDEKVSDGVSRIITRLR